MEANGNIKAKGRVMLMWPSGFREIWMYVILTTEWMVTRMFTYDFLRGMVQGLFNEQK